MDTEVEHENRLGFIMRLDEIVNQFPYSAPGTLLKLFRKAFVANGNNHA